MTLSFVQALSFFAAFVVAGALAGWAATRGLRRLTRDEFLATVNGLSTTNYRVFVMTWATIMTLGFFELATLLHVMMPQAVAQLPQWFVNSTLIFLGAALGFDTAQVIGKRITAKPEVIAAEAAARQGKGPVVETETTTVAPTPAHNDNADTSPGVPPSNDIVMVPVTGVTDLPLERDD